MGMHGGNIYEYIREYGKKPLDFSASVSPFGVDDEIKRAVADAMDECGCYPDLKCTMLRELIADRYFGAGVDDILCGAGASDLIYRFICALKPGRALIVTPAFSEYENALRLYGCDIRAHALSKKDGFALTDDILDAITSDTDLLILNIPHNPTGLIPPYDLVERIVEKCETLGVYILSDECFMDFVVDVDSLFSFAYDRIMVIRAFTKYYGLAGLRLGYCLCRDHDMISKMKYSGPPWNVSSPAQAAGIAALKVENADYRKLIAFEREYMYHELTGLGFYVISGRANFLLFYTDDTGLYERLFKRGILIRDCSDFAGLGSGWYRVAVRTHKENERLFREIRDGRDI